ncbi:hypothetical protein TNCV_2305351 [Trichonephila clavipes]|nr:hypothetical protein TNCV_2305351 [Trichonephila clavipes]
MKIMVKNWVASVESLRSAGLAENHDRTPHITTDPTPCLTIGRRQSQSYARASVLQTCTRPVIGRSVIDDSSDYYFLPLINRRGFVSVTPL